jgi:hypothetical protein
MEHYTVDLDTSEILKCIQEIGLTATDNKLMHSQDLPVAYFATNAMGKMGVKAIQKDMRPYIINFYQSGLLELGKRAIDKELEYFRSPVLYEVEISKWLIDIYINTNKEETQKLSMKYLRELNKYINTDSSVIAKWWNDEFEKVLKSKSVYNKYNDTT